ncbi:MAG TPA: VCBS repeat-containing protein, partial [Labilithrix sp.]
MKLARAVAGFGFVLLAACQGRAPDVPADGPGADAWKAELACSSDTDCNQGESCTGGICQLKRCAAPAHAPSPPLGKASFLLLNRELVAVTSTTTVEGYSTSDRTFVRAGDTMAASGSIVDVAGGNLTGSRPDAVAIATDGKSELAIAQGGRITATVPVGFVPIALASGDVDGDGVDEVVAASSGAQFALCHVQPAGCTTISLPASGITDVAVGDVDGDGFAEAVFAVGNTLYVYNFDAATTKQNAVATADVG